MGTTWKDIKSRDDVLTEDEWAEIDLEAKIVGELIAARREQDITQKALEDLCGIKQPMIARIERGENDPKVGTVLRILRPLGKTLAVVDLPGKSAKAL